MEGVFLLFVEELLLGLFTCGVVRLQLDIVNSCLLRGIFVFESRGHNVLLTILVFLCRFDIEASIVLHSAGFVKLGNNNFICMGSISIGTFIGFL